jgi:hypothetical protein
MTTTATIAKTTVARRQGRDRRRLASTCTRSIVRMRRGFRIAAPRSHSPCGTKSPANQPRTLSVSTTGSAGLRNVPAQTTVTPGQIAAGEPRGARLTADGALVVQLRAIRTRSPGRAQAPRAWLDGERRCVSQAPHGRAVRPGRRRVDDGRGRRPRSVGEPRGALPPGGRGAPRRSGTTVPGLRSDRPKDSSGTA